MANFKKVAPNNWRYRHKYTDVFTGEQKELKKQGFKSKPEAVAHFTKALEELESGMNVQKDLTVVDYVNKWYEEYRVNKVSKNSYRLDKRNIDNHIAPYFKNLLLSNLDNIHYQKFINHLIDKTSAKTGRKLSKRAVEIIHTTMSGAMKRAKYEKRIKDNPVEGAVIYTPREKVKAKSRHKKLKFLPYENISSFLDAALEDNYTYYMFFKFLIETGVRKGEALALKWDNIDLAMKRVYIEETIDYEAKSDDELFDETKTYRSTRDFQIPARLVQQLNAHRVRQEDNKMRFKDNYKYDLDLVFCREDGSPIPKSTLFNAFRRILRKIDMPPLPIHSLRHTFAVLMIESGVEMLYIQEALGHESIQITSDVYSHVSKRIETKSLESFEKYTENILIGDTLGTRTQN
ncbi:site-specific integrase [Alkalihalobacillus sp. LMS6]|uniref:tyrosine-type recombinase/integrase n=1 Tax=Alkalihalobacillus sp. LMS6 TaxID=2924034 RepID=UPI0020D0F967|nr:site-specific integrase [Alkalihalobacillus sp. LMS6]UTR04689.1 site-specific integrase [Alkalihalobacillus sp. LMS6]